MSNGSKESPFNPLNSEKQSEGLTSDLDSAQSKEHTSSYESRKASRSKREIMEDLSRERFPWEE